LQKITYFLDTEKTRIWFPSTSVPLPAVMLTVVVERAALFVPVLVRVPGDMLVR
jgi:hypothetical protein